MKRELKNSGIPWMEFIPSDWNVIRGKNLLKLMNRPVREEDDVVTCFRDGEVVLRSERRTEGFTMSDKEIGYQGINKGDIVIHGMDGFAGAMGVSKSTGKGSPVLIVCNPKANDDARYIIYYLRTLAMNNVFVALATGIRERSCDLRWNKISVLPFVHPSFSEQQKIADYIERKTEEIDSLISLQEQMIEKLINYKKSVVTETVTKGLNPNVQFVPTGIDWIGSIPESWSLAKMDYICSVITDFVASGSFESLRKNVPYLDYPDYAMLVRTADLSGSAKSDKRVYISKHSYDFLSNSNLFGGEIVLPNIGAVGDAYIVPSNLYEKMSLAPNSIMFKTRYIDKYYYYYFSDGPGSQSLKIMCQATAQPKFNKTQLRGLQVVLPSVEEQKEIVDFLDSKCADIDRLITLKQQKIEKLKEYKKSIIYECVTGKINIES